MRWLFIGGGNMATSLIGGLVASGARASDIAVVDPSEPTRERLTQQLTVRTAASLDLLFAADAHWRAANDGDLGVVLAVKPNVALAACTALANAGFTGSPALLSVAAGVRCSSLQRWLGQDTRWCVMRCMPNTPSLIGKGASALYAADASATQADAALNLLNAVGTAISVNAEPDIDAVTALSGSGPAYVFRLAELMIENGKALGLDAAQATRLGIATIEGAAAMMQAGEDDPATLRRKVTSPGGTTQAALEAFSVAGLDDCIRQGMAAASARAHELGEEMDSA